MIGPTGGYEEVVALPVQYEKFCANSSTKFTARWQNGKCASLQNSF